MGILNREFNMRDMFRETDTKDKERGVWTVAIHDGKIKREGGKADLQVPAKYCQRFLVLCCLPPSHCVDGADRFLETSINDPSTYRAQKKLAPEHPRHMIILRSRLAESLKVPGSPVSTFPTNPPASILGNLAFYSPEFPLPYWTGTRAGGLLSR